MIYADELTMVSTKASPLPNGPVPTRYQLGDSATYISPAAHLSFLCMAKKIILLAVLTACTALANTIIVTGIDSSMGLQSIYMDENGASTPIFWSGAIDINVDGYIRQVFCVQLFTDIYLNNTYDTIMDFADTPSLHRVGWLLEHQFPTAALYPSTLQLQGAAFQLAIWDIIEDDGNGFAAGAGKLAQSSDPAHPSDTALLTAARKYETLSEGQTSNYGVVYHNFLNDVPMQNLMGIPVTDGGPSAAPEPAVIVMIFSGIVLIGLGRLRRGARAR
jgi:hypothetical protein